MSTGAECRFVERKPGRWYAELQRWPYGASEDYEEFGPFSTCGEAEDHLSENRPNPGGATVYPLPGCPHDLLESPALAGRSDRCRRCGCWVRAK
jgi:hypothetical protein